jgi:hypothetical protein
VLRNRDGSSIGSPTAIERELEDNMGEEIGFASNIFVFLKRSRMYHC